MELKMKKQNEQMLVALLNAFATNEELSDEEKFKAIEDIHEEMAEIRKVERLNGEVFKLVPTTTRFYASNLGRVLKVTSEGEALCRTIRSRNKTGRYYFDVNVEVDGKRIKCRVSRVIAKTWLDSTLPLLYSSEDKRIVDHISEDTLDNSITNIRVFDQSSNIKRAIYEFNKSVGKECKRCYAEKDGVRKEYPSTALLIKDIMNETNPGYFNHAIKYGHKLNGYSVGYLD